MYPSNQDYKLALMIGADSFNTLDGLEVLPHPLYPSEPWFATGGLAIVFKVRYQGKLYALKCFTKEVQLRQERLKAISAYLKANPSRYFVDFTYLDNEIWVENENGGQGYPVVLMEWVEGLTLDNYLKAKCQNTDTPALKQLYGTFGHLILWLQTQPIAHGDLKHDNILVLPTGQIKLIDYDGMYLPAFTGQKASELGSPCYQHPQRTADYFNEHLDDFSLLILQTTLLAFETEPSLFDAHFNGDGLLFKDTDFADFNSKAIRNTLWELPNFLLPILAANIQKQLADLQQFDFTPYFAHLPQNKLDNEWIRNFADNYSNVFSKIISGNYSLSEVLIEKYKDKWDWYQLSRNLDLNWLEELIEKYKDKWIWENLSRNPNLSWTEEFIEKYKQKWDWTYIGLSSNPKLPWSAYLIEKYKDKWDWGGLSKISNLPWSSEFIEKFKDELDWISLSTNRNLPWSNELIEKYKDKWCWINLSHNPNLIWSEEFIEKYEHKWGWDFLSHNPNLPWSEKIIEKFKVKWCWGFLSQNLNLPWSEEFIEKYNEKWEWRFLGENPNLPWSEDLIEKYKDKLRWDYLSRNLNLPWSEELIEKYKDKWYWTYLSCNPNLPWSQEFIEKYKENWAWGEYKMYEYGLCANPNLPWSDEFIEKFKDEWDYSILCFNKNFVNFILSKLDDELLDKVMAELHVVITPFTDTIFIGEWDYDDES